MACLLSEPWGWLCIAVGVTSALLLPGCGSEQDSRRLVPEETPPHVNAAVSLLQQGDMLAFAASVRRRLTGWTDGDLTELVAEISTGPVVRREDALAALLSAGFDPDSILADTPVLHMVVRPPITAHPMTDRQCLSMIRLLMAAGGDPDIRDRNGFTSLHDMAMALRPRMAQPVTHDAVALLLLYGASVNAETGIRETPADLAFLCEQQDLLGLLESMGGKLHRYADGGTTISQAIRIAQAEAQKEGWPWRDPVSVSRPGHVWQIRTGSGAGMNIIVEIDTQTGEIKKSYFNAM